MLTPWIEVLFWNVIVAHFKKFGTGKQIAVPKDSYPHNSSVAISASK
jgi:hypothetical protein